MRICSYVGKHMAVIWMLQRGVRALNFDRDWSGERRGHLEEGIFFKKGDVCDSQKQDQEGTGHAPGPAKYRNKCQSLASCNTYPSPLRNRCTLETLKTSLQELKPSSNTTQL